MLLWTAWSSKQEQGPDSLIIPVQEPNCFHDALRLTTFIRYEHQLAGLERTQASRTVWVEYLNRVYLEQNRKIVGLEWTLKFPVLHHYTRRSSPHLYPPPSGYSIMPGVLAFILIQYSVVPGVPASF